MFIQQGGHELRWTHQRVWGGWSGAGRRVQTESDGERVRAITIAYGANATDQNRRYLYRSALSRACWPGVAWAGSRARATLHEDDVDTEFELIAI